MGARKAQGLSKKIVLVDARKAQQKRQQKKKTPGSQYYPHGLLPDRRGPRPPVLPATGHCSTVLQLI